MVATIRTRMYQPLGTTALIDACIILRLVNNQLEIVVTVLALVGQAALTYISTMSSVVIATPVA